MNKLSNQLNQKYNINHNNYSNDKNKLTNFLSEKKDKISNQMNFTTKIDYNTINFNNKNNNNKPFTFNKIYNKKKAKKNVRPDWMKPETEKIVDINNRFHKEIIDYVNYIIPNNASLLRRLNTIHRLTKIVQKYQPNWKILLFGSFSQTTSTVFRP